MHRTWVAALLGAIAISQGNFEAIGQDLDYTIVNEQIEPIPLPFQACVYRRTFQNRTDRALKTPYPEHGAVIRKIATAEAGEFREPRGSIEDAARASGYWLWLAAGARLVPLSLGPGEQAAITYSLAGEWLATDAVSTFFPEAGKYTFRLYYDDELTIVVREPRGDDKLIVDQLRLIRSLRQR